MKFRLPLGQQRILMLREGSADAYALRQGGLVREASFLLDDLDLFKGYCQSRIRSKFTVLADLVEEDFRLETIPHVIGPARKQLLARKFDQAYRSTPYRACMSLGRELSNTRDPESKRRDELVLLMALMNQQALNPWLEAMHAQRAQVRGVYSIPVVNGLIETLLGNQVRSALVVTLNRAGLRQIYVDNGKPRFARLATFQNESALDAGRRIATEISRTEQYLSTLRWLPREGGPLRVILVCPEDMRANWRTACEDTDRLAHEFPDLAATARLLGVALDGAAGDNTTHFSDGLWAAGAHRLAPSVDFAPDWAKEHFALGRWRAGIIAAGAVACAVGSSTGAVLLAQATNIDSSADRQAANATRANADYQQVAKSFPQTGVTPEHLKGAVLALDPLAARPITPEPLLIQISQALMQAPAFSLSKIDWEVASSADAPMGGTPARLRAPANPGTPSTTAPSDLYEIAILSGSIAQERQATPRRKIATARSAIEALKKIPGIEVTPIRLPLDVSPTASVKGGDDDFGSAENEPIVIRVARKVVR